MPASQSLTVVAKTAGKNRPPANPHPVAGDAAGLDPRVANRIGEALRAHYCTLVSEPIPDRFAELVSKLEARKS